jgi:hypothetical protein
MVLQGAWAHGMVLQGAWAHGMVLQGAWHEGRHEYEWPRPAALRARTVIRLVIAMSSIVMRLSVDVSIESLS